MNQANHAQEKPRKGFGGELIGDNARAEGVDISYIGWRCDGGIQSTGGIFIEALCRHRKITSF